MSSTLVKEKTKSKPLSLSIKRFDKSDSKYFEEIKSFFKDKLEPIYGPQDKFIQKILDGYDRHCDMLLEDGSLKGLIIYKNHLSNEFSEYDINNSVELKTFALLDSNPKKAGLFISILYNKLAAESIKLNASCIFATISSSRPQVLKITRKLGFQLVRIFKQKYSKNLDETLISHFDPKSLYLFTKNYIEQFI